MFLNSVHEQYPNSDPKQCTVTKLGWVHSAHTQNPGRAHTAHAVPMLWALLRAQQSCRTRSQRRSHICWACTCHDTPRQPAPRSRPHFDVATSRQPKSCRDIKSMSRHHSDHSMSRHQIGVATSFLLPSPQARSRRPFSRSRPPEASPMSRHCFHVATSHTDAHVATLNPCHDAGSAQPKQTRSRLHFLVATSACRDLCMLRPLN